MNSYERVMNRMSGQEVDRLPNLSLVMTFAARQIGVPFGRYVSDYRLLVQGALHCQERFQFDHLCAISDPMREAEGFGADVIIPEDDVPFCRIHRLNDIRDIASLKVTDPAGARRMNDRLEAVRLLSERACGEVPVIGWVEGAVAEGCDLMDMQMALMNFLAHPEEMEHLLNICTEQAILFARAQVRAGADIIGVGDAAASLLGPKLYPKFALPYQKRIIQSIHEEGAKAKLHICGNLNPVLELVAQTGADIIDLDHMVDIERAADLFPQTASICGNFDPVGILLEGTEQMVWDEVARCKGIQNRNRSMISAGCEIPKFTPAANVMAIHEGIIKK